MSMPTPAGAAADPRLLVHLLIPAYADSPLLREAVASVLAQDSPHWQLNIYDDGPPDPALAGWLEGLGDPRVRYERNPVRLGINRNFQRCVDSAGGDLATIMGADDRLLPGYVGTVAAAAAAHPDAAWVQPAVRVIDDTGAPVLPLADRVKARIAPRGPAPRVLGGQDLLASLMRGVWMYFPAVAFRRTVLQQYGFRTGYDVVLDLDVYVRILLRGGCAVYLDEVCFEYRRHAASLSSTEVMTGGRFGEERRYYGQVRAASAALGWSRAARAASVHATSRLHAAATLPAALRSGDLSLAGQVLRHALGSTPRVGAGELTVPSSGTERGGPRRTA